MAERQHAPEPPRASPGHAPEPPRAPQVESALPDFHPDERVFMVGPDGKRVVVTGKEVGTFGRMGYRLEGAEEGKQAAIDYEHNTTGNAWLSAAEGAASTLTLSGSDLALHFLDPEGAESRARQFGTERMLGSIGGGLLGLKAPLLPGGMAIQAGKNIGGKIAGTGIVKGMQAAGGATGVAGRALPGIGAGVVEGIFFGGAEGASKTFLSDKPINAEALLANIGTGALWGGGIGGVFGAGGSIIGDSVDVGRRYFQRGSKAVLDAHGPPSDDLVRAGQAPPKLSAEVRARTKADLGAARGQQAELIRGGRAAQAAAEAEGKSASEAMQWFRGDFDTLDTYSGEALRRIEKAGEKATPEMQWAHQALTEARAATREVMEQNGVFKRSTAIDKGLDLAPEKTVKRINDWGDDTPLANALKHPDLPNRITAQEDALRMAKEAVDGPPDMPRPGAKPWTPFKVQRDVFTKVSNYDDVMLRATGGMDDPALAEVGKRIQQLEQLLETGRPGSKATVEFAKGNIEAAKRAGMDVSWPALLKAADQDGFDTVAFEAMSPDAKTLMQAQFIREAVRRTTQARGGQAPLSFAQKIGRGIIASAAGWAVGGHIGALLSGMVGGGLMGRMLRGTSVGLARRAAYSITDTGKRIAGHIDEWLGETARKVRSPQVPRTAVQVLKSTAFAEPNAAKPKEKGELRQAFAERSEELTRTAGNKDETLRKVNAALVGVRMTDPRLADQMAEGLFRRLEYLYDEMPKAPYPQNPYTKTGWTPCDADIVKWSRCIEVAEDPTAIFRHMENGTLTVEHVGALKAVWPQIYDEIQMDIVSRASELKASLPWAKRVTLSTLFEAPTDDILRPENVFLLQEAHTEPSPEPQQPRPPSTSTPSHSATRAQQLSG